MATRRDLLALGVGLALPLAARAQQTVKPAPLLLRIGMLETVSPSLNRANFESFRDGLRDLGYVEGKDIVIDYRSADGRAEQFPDFVADLVRMKADVIVARGTPAVLAAKLAAPIPVVMTGVSDPVGLKIVASLARPGGHITGFTTLVREMTTRRLELLREAAPRISRIGSLLNMSNPAGVAQWRESESAARTLGLQAVLLDVRDPQGFAIAFDEAGSKRVDALLVSIDTLITEHRNAVAEFAAKHRLPAIYPDSEFVTATGLMSYGVHYPHLYYRAAGYVSRILRGARPAEMPIEQPTKYQLVINQRTARNLGLALPPVLLQRADRVIG
ncbi:MAG TPA: ABC transporter substrate-binding protein [Burkholderiales bacterium]